MRSENPDEGCYQLKNNFKSAGEITYGQMIRKLKSMNKCQDDHRSLRNNLKSTDGKEGLTAQEILIMRYPSPLQHKSVMSKVRRIQLKETVTGNQKVRFGPLPKRKGSLGNVRVNLQVKEDVKRRHFILLNEPKLAYNPVKDVRTMGSCVLDLKCAEQFQRETVSFQSEIIALNYTE
ncbi:hypothetical protein COOONC_21987 [Cooperia oncophora]